MNKFFLTIGILCFLIPFALQAVDRKEQLHIIESYEKELEVLDSEEIDAVIERARLYNQTLYELQIASLSGESLKLDSDMDYEAQLNLSGTGMMGYIQIPKIDVKLPIYHGTSEDVLANGVGHLKGSSFPVGGTNSHSVLTGHRGLPSAELFTRLDEMEKGDTFFVSVGNQTLVYEVVSLQVVKPEEVSGIEIEAERDLVSLVTCTPYGINTHRLIVTGERIVSEDETEIMNEAGNSADSRIPYWILIPSAIVAMILIVVARKRCK